MWKSCWKTGGQTELCSSSYTGPPGAQQGRSLLSVFHCNFVSLAFAFRTTHLSLADPSLHLHLGGNLLFKLSLLLFASSEAHLQLECNYKYNLNVANATLVGMSPHFRMYRDVSG